MPKMLMPQAFQKLVRQEGGQNTFEYMLVVGGVAVLIVAALILAFPEVVSRVAGLACESIDTAASPPASWRSCLV